jgi:hypothetical protein
MEFCFVCGINTSPEEFSVRPSFRHAVSRKLIIMAENITHVTCLCWRDDARI